LSAWGYFRICGWWWEYKWIDYKGILKKLKEEVKISDKYNIDSVKLKYGYINKLSQDNIKYNDYYLNEIIEVATEKYYDKIIKLCFWE